MSKYYIARDEDESLYLYDKVPYKKETLLGSSDDTDTLCKLDNDDFFPDVSLADEEPKVLTIEESPWIKFTDKHPNIGDNIIIMYKNNVIDKICYYPIVFNGWDGICTKQFDGCEAVAWMYIPKFKE